MVDSKWVLVAVRATVAVVLCGVFAFGYAWIAPWSDEMGILVMEPIAFGVGLVLLGVFSSSGLWLSRRLLPAWFSGCGMGAVFLLAVPLGIALSIYLYPPMKRYLDTPREVVVAAERLMARLERLPPWGERTANRRVVRSRWDVEKARKGFFGWSLRRPWTVRGTFYLEGDGQVGVRYRLRDDGAEPHEVRIYYPDDVTPDWAVEGFSLDQWRSSRWPWAWFVGGDLADPEEVRIRAPAPCSAERPVCPENSWSLQAVYAGGINVSWYTELQEFRGYTEDLMVTRQSGRTLD